MNDVDRQYRCQQYLSVQGKEATRQVSTTGDHQHRGSLSMVQGDHLGGLRPIGGSHCLGRGTAGAPRNPKLEDVQRSRGVVYEYGYSVKSKRITAKSRPKAACTRKYPLYWWHIRIVQDAISKLWRILDVLPSRPPTNACLYAAPHPRADMYLRPAGDFIGFADWPPRSHHLEAINVSANQRAEVACLLSCFKHTAVAVTGLPVLVPVLCTCR